MTEIGLTHKKRIEYIDAMRGFYYVISRIWTCTNPLLKKL